MKKKQGKKLAGEIASIPDNIKAEIIVAALLKAGIRQSELQPENAGTFNRPYRKDVLGAACVERPDHTYGLKLKLSRNGLYDLLPEALSHAQQIDEGAKREVKFLTESYRQRKKEEAAARKFFGPFEQEFFLQGVRLEQKEEELINNPSEVFFSFLSDFWGVSQELNIQYKELMLRLMPFIHSIAGNLERIKDCLHTLLDVPVSYVTEHRKQSFSTGHNKLGKEKLGMDFSLGSCVYAVPHVVFTLGPVEQHKLIDFLPGGCVNDFIHRFFSYTIPFEVETVLQILAQPYTPAPGDVSFGTLGYSASI